MWLFCEKKFIYYRQKPCISGKQVQSANQDTSDHAKIYYQDSTFLCFLRHDYKLIAAIIIGLL